MAPFSNRSASSYIRLASRNSVTFITIEYNLITSLQRCDSSWYFLFAIHIIFFTIQILFVNTSILRLFWQRTRSKRYPGGWWNSWSWRKIDLWPLSRSLHGRWSSRWCRFSKTNSSRSASVTILIWTVGAFSYPVTFELLVDASSIRATKYVTWTAVLWINNVFRKCVWRGFNKK